MDRLNKREARQGSPESDIILRRSHVGWAYANDGLFEQARPFPNSERQKLAGPKPASSVHWVPGLCHYDRLSRRLRAR